MRLKLVLLTSLIAALVAVLLSIAINFAAFGSIDQALHRWVRWMYSAVYLPPFLTALLAGIFVYRHTASRRKLQGALTAVLAVIYSLATIVLLKLSVK
jgi:hypothetical protein